MAKYKQRKDGRYQTSVIIDGKKQWITAHSSKDLEKKITEINYLKEQGIYLNNNNITLGKFCEKWLDINSVGKEEGTIEEYEYIINSYIKPKLGNKKLKSIKQYDIQEVVNSIIEDGHKKLAKTFLRYIKRILNDAIQNDLITKNVANSIDSPIYKAKEKIPLTDEEDRILIECSKTHKHGLFFLFIRFTGVRKEEAAAIEIDDIDFKKNTILINKAISFRKNQGKLKTTKNRKQRNVYILEVFKKQLEERVNYCKQNNIKYLFTKQTKPNERLSDSAIKRMLESFLLDMNNTYFKELEEKNNKKEDNNKIKFTLHQLRHSFCTMLYYAGIGIKEAQELMGHSSADMVYGIYTHLDMEKGKPYEKLTKATEKFLK